MTFLPLVDMGCGSVDDSGPEGGKEAVDEKAAEWREAEEEEEDVEGCGY